jgi:hypothetical protein
MAMRTTYRHFRSKRDLGTTNTRGNAQFVYDEQGAITACCIIDDNATFVKVGFSFLNPTDAQVKISGKGRALQRAQRDPIHLEVPKTDSGKLKLTETIHTYIKQALIPADDSDFVKNLFDHFKITPYNGKWGKCSFVKWIPKLIETL